MREKAITAENDAQEVFLATNIFKYFYKNKK